MRQGWVAAVLLVGACKDPGGIPIVRVEIGTTPATPHFLTDLIVLAVDGQDLVRIDPQTGLTDIVYQGVKSSWPLSAAQSALVHTNNGDLERVSLEGTSFHVLYSDDPEDFAGVRADPFGKFILWADGANVLHSRDTTADNTYTYPFEGGELNAVPRAVASDATAALVQEIGGGGRFFLVDPIGSEPTPLALPADFAPFGSALGVSGVRIAGLDAAGERVQIRDETGGLVLDMPIEATWLGRAAVDPNGASILSWEERDCLSDATDPCEQSVSVLVRYPVGQQKREIAGEQTVVGQADVLDRAPELSPDGERLLVPSNDGLWFVGNPET